MHDRTLRTLASVQKQNKGKTKLFKHSSNTLIIHVLRARMTTCLFFRADIPSEISQINNIKLIGQNSVEFKEPLLIKDDCKVRIVKCIVRSEELE